MRLKPFRNPPTEAQVFQLLDRWIDDLARGDYAGALARTEQDSYYSWSPALLQAVIEGYGLPEPHPSGESFTVTARAAASGSRSEYRVDWDGQPPVLARAYSSIPLNGEWSDLSVSCRIEARGKEAVAVLEEVHVY